MLFPFRNMRDVLGLHAKVSSQKVAVISFDADFNRRDLTYLEFVGKSHQVANFLYEDLDIQRGDTIAIISPNHENALLLYFATWVIGASVVAINADATPEQITHCLQESAAKILFADHTRLTTVSPIVSSLASVEGVIQIGGQRQDNYLRFEDLAANRPTTFLGDESGAKGADVPMTGGNERTARLTDTALITYHNDIAITVTQGNLLESAYQFAQITALTGNQVAMSGLPLHEDVAQSVLAPLIAGGTLILFEQFSSDEFWHVLVQERVHTALLNAQQLTQMVTTARQHVQAGEMRFGGKIIQQDTKHIRHITSVDCTLTTTIACEFEDTFGIPLITGVKHPRTDQLLTLMPITLAWTHHQAILFGDEALSVGVALTPLTVTDGTLHQVHADATQTDTGLSGYAKLDANGLEFFYLDS